MKNVLVTGGAGFIGSHITELLIKKRFSVFIIDNLTSGHKRLINKKARFFRVDINDYKKVSDIIKKNNIESIIHLAAKTNVVEAEKKPKIYNNNNVKGTLNLVRICKKLGVKNFIFSSSCAVYGDASGHVKENFSKKPKGVYGKTKLKGENLIKKFFNGKKINYGILRYFNVVGASPSNKIGQINEDDQLFKNLSKEIKKRNPVFNVYGKDHKTYDGTCVRDFIHVYDLAEIHIMVLKKINALNKSIILNCGYGKGSSVLETINEFKKFTKRKVKINFKKKRNGDIVTMIANVQKLKNFLKWKPKFSSLKLMVNSSINWEKKL